MIQKFKKLHKNSLLMLLKISQLRKVFWKIMSILQLEVFLVLDFSKLKKKDFNKKKKIKFNT